MTRADAPRRFLSPPYVPSYRQLMTHHENIPITGQADYGDRPHRSGWRIAAWSAAALILLVPLVAMQFTDEVAWSVADFAVAAALALSTGLAYEWAVRTKSNTAYRAGTGVALVGAFLLVWLSLGVGIIGRDGDPANLLYGGVLTVGIVSALLARFKPAGMARALFATALAQAVVAAIAVFAGLGAPYSGPLLIGLNGFFVALFAGAALLFQQAARGGAEQDAS